jgi:hypothetical protein
MMNTTGPAPALLLIMVFRRKKSVFLKIINYLNKQPIGFIYTADKIASGANVLKSSVHAYSDYFCVTGFVRKSQLGKIVEYELIKHFPDTLNTTILNELVTEIYMDDTWQNWFMEIENRIQMKYNEKYGDKNEDKKI